MWENTLRASVQVIDAYVQLPGYMFSKPLSMYFICEVAHKNPIRYSIDENKSTQ